VVAGFDAFAISSEVASRWKGRLRYLQPN